MKPALLLLALISATIAAEETVISPTYDSAALFKNGLAVVRVSFPVNGPGLYRWDKIPRVVHGTLWVESDGEVNIRSTTRMVEIADESEAPTGDLQRDLAGKKVAVTLKSPTAYAPSFSGTVWEVPPAPTNPTWDASYRSDSFRSFSLPNPIISPTVGNFLVLTDESGTRRYIDRSSIATLSASGPFVPLPRRQEQPVLVFDVRKSPTTGGVVRISYLTKGLAWMPSYQLDLSDSKRLRIRQNAVIRNESTDLENTEIQLISGYPNVRFGEVDSPISPGTNLAAFFQQVNGADSGATGILSNVLTQRAVYMNSAPTGGTSPLADLAELGNASDDVHYQSIGRRSLKVGDSLSLDIASAAADYERVVEWTVPDPRDERGRYRPGSRAENDAWDAVRFSNPFEFPMTTAAATIVEGGKFRGQSQSEWVNPGQQTCLRITRALSVRTESSETEEEGQREIIWVGGDEFQRTTVNGQLKVKNFRGKDATLVIRGEFSGELLEVDGDPAKSLRTEGVSSVNPRRRLDWTVKLKAGEEKELSYRYQVLVDR